jgi:hypothetical protein
MEPKVSLTYSQEPAVTEIKLLKSCGIVEGALSSCIIKRLVRESDHSPPSSVDVRNA